MEAIEREILESGSESDIELMKYTLDEHTGSFNKKCQNGWMRDRDDKVVLGDASLILEGGIVVDKGVKGKVLEIAKDADTWPGPPAAIGARIDFGGTIKNRGTAGVQG